MIIFDFTKHISKNLIGKSCFQHLISWSFITWLECPLTLSIVFLTTVILIWTISIYCDLLTLRIKLNEIFIVTFILSKKCTVHHFAWDPYIRQLYKIIHCHYFDINKNTFLCLFPYLGPSWSDLQLPVQSVPITTKVVSLNPVHGEVYSIQHYVIKFVSYLWQVGCYLQFPSPIKLTATI